MISDSFDKKTRDSNGLLSTRDILSLKLNVELVTLSACQTGVGQIGQGNSIIGLSRSFLIAGANNVISTLWSIDDEYTKDFMISMYKKITEDGFSPCKAINKTKREFINSEKYKQHEWHWSAYTFWGI